MDVCRVGVVVMSHNNYVLIRYVVLSLTSLKITIRFPLQKGLEMSVVAMS